ncbi:hypothetical protein [uncultured Corynebacterium sp.]|uniref:hypothetical protein n=1 Tax=uncultured Corynebacterium sp. TaxID=159447 RepID=UPI00288A8650|nr:hypothetical protein [uncultured Corynebacterium sp.]
MTKRLRKLGGGGLAAVLAVVVVVSLVGWVLSALGKPAALKPLQPVPQAMPPIAGVEVPNIDVHSEGRTADKLTYWSSQLESQTGISGQALRAYGNAELIARDAWPECNLRWNTLAGLGWVETRHGTYNGNWLRPSKLDENGYPDPQITGIALDGSNGTAHTPDTDGGQFDGDAEFDRAVGPLQFIPSSWSHVGRDANGDGVADPNQIDDAALGAAALLCFGGRNMDKSEDWEAGILNYNQSRDYLERVAAAANSYSIPQPASS